MARFITSEWARSARRASLVGVAALALALSTAASAQIVGGPGGPGGMGGTGHPGMHGGAVGVEMLQQIKAKLNLDTAQQLQFDVAAARGKGAREAAGAELLKLRDSLRDELAKPEPDLGTMARLADEAHARNQDAHKLVRAEWLRLYATFTTEQKAVVKETLTARMNRAEAMRQRMRLPAQGG